ncbi:MAG TPA: hypothetical protein VGM82_01010 [Gemmatimonadaceae bacterium]|jgi:hypothetical protein
MMREPLDDVFVRLEGKICEATDRGALPADSSLLSACRRLEADWELYRHWPTTNPERQRFDAFARQLVVVCELLLCRPRDRDAAQTAIAELQRLRIRSG